MEPNLEKLKGYQEWRKLNGQDFSLLDYIGSAFTAETAIAFTALFLPEFVEHEGGIFFKDVFTPEGFAQWHERLGGDIRQSEKVMSHRHITDLFPEGLDSVGMENLMHLAESLKQSWEARLKMLYPSREFEWFINWDENEETVAIAFCTVG